MGLLAKAAKRYLRNIIKRKKEDEAFLKEFAGGLVVKENVPGRMIIVQGDKIWDTKEAEEEEMVNKGIEILKEMPWNKGKGQNKNRGKEV